MKNDITGSVLMKALFSSKHPSPVKPFRAGPMTQALPPNASAFKVYTEKRGWRRIRIHLMFSSPYDGMICIYLSYIQNKEPSRNDAFQCSVWSFNKAMGFGGR